MVSGCCPNCSTFYAAAVAVAAAGLDLRSAAVVAADREDCYWMLCCWSPVDRSLYSGYSAEYGRPAIRKSIHPYFN